MNHQLEDTRTPRQKYEDEHYTKQIECPEHPAHEARDHHDPDQLHEATLYCFPHRFAGVWECPVTGDSDAHECTEFKTEETVSSYWSYEKEDTIDVEGSVEVCVDCGVAQEGDY